MQEEKKTQSTIADKNDKSHHQKRHGYFMTPPPNAQNRASTNEQISASANTGANKPQPKNNDRQNKSNTKVPQKQLGDNSGNQAAQKKNNKHKKKKTSSPAPLTTAIDAPQTQQPATDKIKPKNQTKEPKPIPQHSADDYEAYKFAPDLFDEHASGTDTKSQGATDEPKSEVVGIRFKSSGKIYYFDPNGRTLKKGSHAIVDTARGQEFGEVAMANSFVKTSDIVTPLRPVLRSATTADVEHHKSNKQKEEDAFKICNEKISEHKLEMKLIDAQYTFDNTKLLFYFTSSERVDFRELVKDLASVFRTRIELRQIGIRDEAKLMGGLGMCGRPLCCTLFLSDFDQVSIKMAKEQNLSLNSSKISGICGRLMCCLKYEHEAYEYEIKRTPPVDSLVRTENGDGIVTEISPLRGTIKVRLLATPEVPPKSYHRDNVSMLRKKQDKQ